MKNKQMKMVILVLIGLVLFTTSLTLLLYSKQKDMQAGANKAHMVQVYMSAKDIKKGDLIDAHSIIQGSLPEQYLGGMALSASEIIGRYARVDIYANEPFRKEKISLAKPLEESMAPEQATNAGTVKEETQTAEIAEGDTITLPLSVFKNIDKTLQSGDTIDIVSVIPKAKGKKEIEFSTKYIALGVTIKAFVNNTQRAKGYVIATSKESVSYANEIVLELEPKNLENFLNLYYETLELNQNRVYNTNNSGHLWMIKCAKEQNEETQKAKEKMLNDYVQKVVHKKRQAKEEVSISYEN